jgi:beta-lactamase regulating signal transducer with metallopeptidase domain
VLLLALIAAVTVPAMGVLVKHFELGVFVAEPITLEAEMPREPARTNYETSVASLPAGIANEVHTAVEGPILVEAGSARTHIPWCLIVLYGWMSMTLILLGRLLVAVVSSVVLLRRAQPCGCEQIRQAEDIARSRLGITKGLSVRSSRNVSSPVIWCWSRQLVLLVPSDLDRKVDWVSVICHELAHWRRKDHLTGLIAELVVCILPWNPLLWWSKKGMVRFSEQACDDWVVAGGQPCEDYAQSLLNFRPQKQVAFVPAVVSSKKTLAGRVHRILKDSCSNPRTGAAWALTASAIAICLAVGIAFAQTRPSHSTGTIKTKLGRSAVIERPAFPTMTIKGRLLYSDNEPAYRGHIIALPVTSHGARINKEGYFELPWSPTWIEEGQPVHLMAKSGSNYTPIGGRRRYEAAVVEVHDPTQPVTIRLEPAPKLAGRMVDPNGRQIIKYRATLSLPTDFKCQAPVFVENVANSRAEHIFRTVPLGPKYKMTIQAEGYQTRQLTVDTTDRSKEPIDIGTITLQPQYPTGPVVADQNPNPDLEKEFHDIYRLETGEVIKLIKPPFVLGRQEYLLNTPIPLGLKSIGGWQVGFHWDGELKMYSGYTGSNLGGVLRYMLDMPEYDFHIPRGLNLRLPHGDWIVRAELPMAEQLTALEDILRAELVRSIRFEKRTVERDVIIAKGRYEFKSHPNGEEPNHVHITWDGTLTGGGGARSSPAELFRLLEEQIEVKIVDETEPIEDTTIRYRMGHLSRIDRDPELRGERLRALLDNLAKTTSLEFKVEHRPADIWFVTEAKAN